MSRQELGQGGREICVTFHEPGILSSADFGQLKGLFK